MNIETNAIIIEKPFEARCEKIILPVPKQHDLIVEIGLCGICTPEQRVFKGTSTKKYPYWGGHELFGDVKVILNPTSNFKVGDRIIIALMNRCGNCFFCKNGLDNHCSYVNNDSSYYSDKYNGPRGFASVLSIPEYKAFKAPKELSPTHLALIEPTACVLRSVKSSSPKNNYVGIIGSGTMGLIHAIALKTLGFDVIIFDDNKKDLIKAEKIPVNGAYPLKFINKEKILELTNREGISSFFCTRYGSEKIESAIKSVNRGGDIILFQSIPDEQPLLLNLNYIHYNEIKLIGTIAQSSNDLNDSIAFMRDNFNLFNCLTIEKISSNNPLIALKKSLNLNINRIHVEFNPLN